MPPGTRVLIAPLDGVGRDYPASIEKLCPVLSYYVVKDWREGCERCKQILRYGGMGHTMSIHSQNEQVILEFGLQKPAFRIVRQHADDPRVDRPDDRARPGDDARLRRLRRQHHVRQHLAAPPAEHQAAGLRSAGRSRIAATVGVPEPPVRSDRRLSALPRAPRGADGAGSAAERCRARIDQFLGSRGFEDGGASATDTGRRVRPPSAPGRLRPRGRRSTSCAKTMSGWRMQAGRRSGLGERAIVTPAARDLGEAHDLRVASWRREDSLDADRFQVLTC